MHQMLFWPDHFSLRKQRISCRGGRRRLRETQHKDTLEGKIRLAEIVDGLIPKGRVIRVQEEKRAQRRWKSDTL